MTIIKCKNANDLGATAAVRAAGEINTVIKNKGSARILVSTGQSQFEFLKALREQNIQWDKVEMFHLDEYIGIDESHPASFVRYLKERFTNGLLFKHVRFIDGTVDPKDEIAALNSEISKALIDVAFIGIGENAHIAFNDPPADFMTDAPYHIVQLNDTCKAQQVREGWFKTVDDVPVSAVSVTPKQIMASSVILSIVPHKAKAEAVKNTLNTAKPNNMIPASLLKEHPNWTLFLDEESASLLD